MRLVPKILVILFIVMLGYVVQRAYVMKLGYEIEGLRKEKKNLEQIHNSLLIERAALTSTERIEKIAISFLGLKNPGNNQIVLVENYNEKDRRVTYARSNAAENDSDSAVKIVKYINQKM